MNRFLTSKERLALDLIFDARGESQLNRTSAEYEAMGTALPNLEALYVEINDILRSMAERGDAPFQICNFSVGDRYPRYEDFPTSLSRETIRQALTKAGYRKPRQRMEGGPSSIRRRRTRMVPRGGDSKTLSTVER